MTLRPAREGKRSSPFAQLTRDGSDSAPRDRSIDSTTKNSFDEASSPLIRYRSTCPVCALRYTSEHVELAVWAFDGSGALAGISLSGSSSSAMFRPHLLHARQVYRSSLYRGWFYLCSMCRINETWQTYN